MKVGTIKVKEYQKVTNPNEYVSAGKPITVTADMKVTAMEHPTGNCVSAKMYKVEKAQ